MERTSRGRPAHGMRTRPFDRGRGVTILVILLIVLFTSLVQGSKESRPGQDVIKRWFDGPVRYLMTSQEYDDVLALESLPELARFITKFWTRRDPTPGTMENEYRRTYWGRVLDANRRFRDSTIPGWKTDRGKVFILLGEPDDVQKDEHPSMSATENDRFMDAGQRGVERWTYRRRLSRSASPELVVAFVRDASLDWKLSSNPDLLQPSFPGMSTLDSTNPSFGGIENANALKANSGSSPGAGEVTTTSALLAETAPPPIDTSLFANYDLGLEMSVPSTPEAVIATVSTREFLAGFSSVPSFEYFRAQDGATFVNIGALVQATELYGTETSGVSSLRLYASIVPAQGSRQPRYASNESQPVRFDLKEGPPPGGLIEVWTGLALSAGRYSVTLAIEDSLTGRLGRSTAEMDVPDFSQPRLALSTLILASSLSETGGRLGATARSSGTFKTSESLGIYFEVYGLTGPSPRFEVSYRFYREDKDAPVPIGKPIPFADRTEAAQGWTVPLSKWPVGRYRVEVTVTGTTGASQTASAPFEVVE